MENETNKIIARIRALFALAESSHSKAEKETAAATAQKLIAQYQVSQAQLDEVAGKQNEEDDLEGKIVYETGKKNQWKSELAFGLSELNNAYCLEFNGIRTETGHRRGKRYRVFGRPTDIALTIYMFEFLVNTINSLSFKFIPKTQTRGVNPERESWCLGCVRGFLSKMKEAKGGVLAEANQTTAMILLNRPKEIEEKYVAKTGNKISNVKPSKARITQLAFTSGYNKGQTLEVNAGLAGGEVQENKLLK
jgi:hypothetical protein